MNGQKIRADTSQMKIYGWQRKHLNINSLPLSTGKYKFESTIRTPHITGRVRIEKPDSTKCW